MKQVGVKTQKTLFCLLASVFLFVSFVLCLLPSVYAQDDMVKLIEKKQKEIKQKEIALKNEEERLNAIKRDVEDKIEKYSKLLGQIENAVKELEQFDNQKLEQVVRTYEAMPLEDAAARLSVLEEGMAVKIILKMKTKKAAAVMALIEPKKAAAITEGMTKSVKKFPAN